MNYLLFIVSHLKANGSFILNAVLDLNCVKCACGTKNNLPVLCGIKHYWFDKLPGG